MTARTSSRRRARFGWRGVASGLSLAAAVAVLMTAPLARAQSKGKGPLSPYERETLEIALKKVDRTLEPAPEGKIVEALEVAPFEVFDEREGFFQVLNVFHATTLPAALRREVLLSVGQPWDRDLADETARNLRTLPQLSLVLVVPVRGTTPDTVRLLVLTKDVWSLRLSWDLKVGSGGLELLRLEPTETNLAGTHQSVATRFILRPETYTLGVSYTVPRLQGQRYSFGVDANVIFNKASGDPEGSYGSTIVTRPLYSSRTEWAWLVGNDWRNERVRRYVDTTVALFNARVTPEADALRDEYHAQRFTETVAVTRSFGVENKLDVTLGAEMSRRAYDLPPTTLERFPEEVLREYTLRRLPVGETRVGPAVRARAYTTSFHRVLDFETIGLQEDFRLGYDVSAKIYPVFSALGSSRTFFGTDATAQYTWAVGDGLVRVGGELLNELEESRISDAAVLGNVRFTTPKLGFGRFVLDGTVLNRYRNYLNRSNLLGGDTRLRGYPSGFFVGKDLVAGNLEYRSPTARIFTILLGGAAFVDAGHAFSGFDSFKLQESVGAGFRILFPQLDRVVFRGDAAFPLKRPLPAGVSPFGFFLAFEQAFDLASQGTSIAPSRGTGSGLLNQ